MSVYVLSLFDDRDSETVLGVFATAKEAHDAIPELGERYMARVACYRLGKLRTLF